MSSQILPWIPSVSSIYCVIKHYWGLIPFLALLIYWIALIMAELFCLSLTLAQLKSPPPFSHVSPLKEKNEGKRAFRLTGSAQPEKIDVPSVDRILIVHSSHELNEMIVPPKHCFQPRIHRWFIYDWVFGLGETDIHFYSNNRGSFNYVIQIWLIAKTQFDPLLPKVNFGTFSSACTSIYHNLPLKHRQKRKMCVYMCHVSQQLCKSANIGWV